MKKALVFMDTLVAFFMGFPHFFRNDRCARNELRRAFSDHA